MWKLIALTALLWRSGQASGVSCKDALNKDVDWYIIYKAPAGKSFVYIDTKGKVTRGNSVDSPTGALANTLRPIFKSIRQMSPSFGFVSYSDQPPGSSADVKEFGHSKGVLLMDRTGPGVWLVHSTPQFPFRRSASAFWPPSGDAKGQTFLCVSLPYAQFRLVGLHLQHIAAFPFEHDVPDSFHREILQAVDWTKLEPPAAGFAELESPGGTKFKAIPKRTSFDEAVGDLYITVAAHLQSDVLVQVWGNQQDDSFCEPGRSVLNVEKIKTSAGQWEPKADHSKWCVARDQNRHWVCVADVNRCVNQYERRGGALCVESAEVQQKFLGFAKEWDTCPTAKKKPRTCDSPGTSRRNRIMFGMRPGAELEEEAELSHGVDFLNLTDSGEVYYDDGETTVAPATMG